MLEPEPVEPVVPAVPVNEPDTVSLGVKLINDYNHRG